MAKVKLRAEPNINAVEIYTCPKTATVQVLESSAAENMYCKVSVNGHTGYVAKRLLSSAPIETLSSKAEATATEEDMLEKVAKARGLTVPVLIQTLVKEEAKRLGIAVKSK
jgi:hypothetical protein